MVAVELHETLVLAVVVVLVDQALRAVVHRVA